MDKKHKEIIEYLLKEENESVLVTLVEKVSFFIRMGGSTVITLTNYLIRFDYHIMNESMIGHCIFIFDQSSQTYNSISTKKEKITEVLLSLEVILETKGFESLGN